MRKEFLGVESWREIVGFVRLVVQEGDEKIRDLTLVHRGSKDASHSTMVFTLGVETRSTPNTTRTSSFWYTQSSRIAPACTVTWNLCSRTTKGRLSRHLNFLFFTSNFKKFFQNYRKNLTLHKAKNPNFWLDKNKEKIKKIYTEIQIF